MPGPELQPTAGVEFFDLRRSPMKLVECIDHPSFNWQKGQEVSISGSNGVVYGPYRLDEEFGRGNGKILFKAFKLNAGAVRTKPLTKAELEAELVKMSAQLAELQAAKGKK